MDNLRKGMDNPPKEGGSGANASLLLKAQYFADPEFPFDIRPYTILPEEVIEGHAHEFYELVYVRSGDAVHEWGGHAYRLQAGDLFVIEPHVEHQYRGGAQPTEVFNMLFEKSLLQRELDHLAEMSAFVRFFYVAPFLRSKARFIPHLRLSGEDRGRLEDNLKVMLGEMQDHQAGYRLVVKTRLIETFVQLSRASRSMADPAPASAEEPAVGSIRLVKAMLEQHADQPFTLEQLAAVAGMSTSSLTAKFKEQYGCTIVEYKHGLQVRRACMLLLETDMTVLDIAYEVGVRDISYFHRLFRDKTGTTPNRFRKEQDGGSRESTGSGADR